MNCSLIDFENNFLKQHCQCVNFICRTDSYEKLLYQNSDGEKFVRLYIKKPADISVYKALLSVQNQNLCTVYEVSEDENGYAIYEEYCEGMTLAELSESGTTDPYRAVEIALQIGRGLYALHKNGIVHRDIKPENIIILNTNSVKIIDYNIAKIFKRNSSADTRILGTVGYAAPEQYGIAQTDFRSDIFSLGVLLNSLITGVHPSIKMCDNRHISAVLKKCLSINPADRYSSTEQLCYALEKTAKAVRR